MCTHIIHFQSHKGWIHTSLSQISGWNQTTVRLGGSKGLVGMYDVYFLIQTVSWQIPKCSSTYQNWRSHPFANVCLSDRTASPPTRPGHCVMGLQSLTRRNRLTTNKLESMSNHTALSFHLCEEDRYPGTFGTNESSHLTPWFLLLWVCSSKGEDCHGVSYSDGLPLRMPLLNETNRCWWSVWMWACTCTHWHRGAHIGTHGHTLAHSQCLKVLKITNDES